ncbi:MAG: TolB family protein [Acidimicrobiales bacterium]
MTDPTFDPRLANRLRAYAQGGVRPIDPLAIAEGAIRKTTRPRLHRGLVLLAAALLVTGGLVAALVAGSRPTGPIADGWIAYATDGPSPGENDITSGSDIYLVRSGGEPILIAGRDGGATRNACPSFSPNGTRLAYASSSGPAIVVRGMDAAGVTSESIRIAVPGGGWPICVRWSADGKRLAYLNGPREVVLGLDGSTLARTAGDPGLGDLTSPPDDRAGLSSPSGEWVASVRVDGDACQLVVARPDGTDVHVIPLRYCPYAIAAWSPDSTRILLMEDVSGMDFTMHEVAFDSGVQSVVVSTVRTNGARSWPGWGDVSWQPVLP